ncbi:integrase [Roseobacter denitrificans]|uniref:Phage integrase family domain protein, putative n=1 Tax=Roseobacter denitrificans (strain ATCC 33942 / OCh 114) TaxID=375451 RepID=Q167M1_ROSDO|nr:site-specific integrase [Roseobacter denitrificans]ABG31822.1 phage integrase family domain protein, putative [Roseobacter denitrificans OCh 114]AVL51387.1 integrase [Roseobacter denitrificans]SFF86499.1 Phage integrase family protein [Roseobacter denitrificans OCh 114]
MRKVNEENERIKRKYFQYRKTAQRKDEATIDKDAEAILHFEASTNYAPFKKFRIEQAIRYRDKLDIEKNKKTGKPLAKATIAKRLASIKAFIFWLADQQGYKSRIRYSDADYFNMDAKGQRVANAVRERPHPSLEMVRHAFNQMPANTELERRNAAVIAFFMISGARDGAAASLRLKHINLVDGYVFQDAREVKTKNSKTFTTYFMPVDPIYMECFCTWVQYLQSELLFGPDDPLFPPPEMGLKDGQFTVVGLKRETYQNANALRTVVKQAFENAGLPIFAPHSLRKTLTKWATVQYPTHEAFKAFSQNIGHSNVATTLSAYCPVSTERQGELIKAPKIPA